MPAGDRGLLSDPAHTLAFRDNIDVTWYRRTPGTKAFNALYGNRIEGVAPEKQEATENPRWPVRRPIGSVRWCSSSRSAAHRRIR